MIRYRDFKRLMADAEKAYPKVADDVAEREWWRERGVDLDALQRWALEQSREDLTEILPLMLVNNPRRTTAQVLGGGVASAYHMGFLFGWLLHEKEHGS